MFCPDGFLTSSLRLYLLTFHIFVWNKGTWTRRPDKSVSVCCYYKGELQTTCKHTLQDLYYNTFDKNSCFLEETKAWLFAGSAIGLCLCK